jgi:hypothetical protein
MRWLLLMVIAFGGCRKKPQFERMPTPVEAPPAAPTPPTNDEPPSQGFVPVEAPPLRGDPPTNEQIMARLQPLFPEIARCISAAGPVTAPEKYLRLTFSLSPATGTLVSAELEGHDGARGCTTDVLRQLKFDPWPGTPSIITLPLTHAGMPVPLSAFGDGGAK